MGQYKGEGRSNIRRHVRRQNISILSRSAQWIVYIQDTCTTEDQICESSGWELEDTYHGKKCFESVVGRVSLGMRRTPGKLNHDRAFPDELDIVKVKVIGGLLVFRNHHRACL